VLVGTISVEKSEKLAGILKKMGVKLEVLNAKNHEREPPSWRKPGRKGAVTVSTNMAGRGTDILLGGNPEVQARESLRKQNIDPSRAKTSGRRAGEVQEETDRNHEEVVALGGCTSWPPSGTNRGASTTSCAAAPAARGPRQLPLLSLPAGRPAPHSSAASACRPDAALGMERTCPSSPSSSQRIAAAQKAVEAQNFESRKHLLEYDDIMNSSAVHLRDAPPAAGGRASRKDRNRRDGARCRGKFVDMRCSEKSPC